MWKRTETRRQKNAAEAKAITKRQNNERYIGWLADSGSRYTDKANKSAFENDRSSPTTRDDKSDDIFTFRRRRKNRGPLSLQVIALLANPCVFEGLETEYEQVPVVIEAPTAPKDTVPSYELGEVAVGLELTRTVHVDISEAESPFTIGASGIIDIYALYSRLGIELTDMPAASESLVGMPSQFELTK
jgi:hypothetical protein